MKIGNITVENRGIFIGLLAFVFVAGSLALPRVTKADTVTEVEPKEVIRPFTEYRPAAGETLDTIREKFGVSAETIIWSHELSGNPRFSGNEVLTIPPTSGVVYHAVTGDTYYNLSQRFGVSESELVKWNSSGTLNPGAPVILPGLHYPKHEMTDQKNKAGLPALNLKRIPGREVKRGAPFVGGWCTSWVYLRGGQHLPWRGNAKYWPQRSAEAGWNHSRVPKVGAMYAEPWYSPYGHISLVVATDPDGSFIVSEMPTFGLGNPSYRIVPAVDSRAVFIYYP